MDNDQTINARMYYRLSWKHIFNERKKDCMSQKFHEMKRKNL
jgi:hypothetical protein